MGTYYMLRKLIKWIMMHNKKNSVIIMHIKKHPFKYGADWWTTMGIQCIFRDNNENIVHILRNYKGT